jgi:hypothetical protein
MLDAETAVKIDEVRGRVEELLNRLASDPAKLEKLLKVARRK